MPVTPSHIAAILPFSRTALPLSALAIGAMIPDAPLLTLQFQHYPLTHSLAGVPTVNLAAGLACFALWWWVLRGPTIHWLPLAIRQRWPAHKERAPAPMTVIGGILVGALTHVIWDHGTHHYGLITQAVPILRQPLLGSGIPGYAYAQSFSSIAGGLAVLAWFARRPVRPVRSARPTDRWCVMAWLALTLVTVIITGIALPSAPSALRVLARFSTTFVAAWSVAALAMHGSWRLASSRRRRRSL